MLLNKPSGRLVSSRSLPGRACMAAAISLAKTWNGKLGNGILLQVSRTACNCPYLLLTLGSLSVN